MKSKNPDPKSFDPGQLDRHIDWLRRLARSLVRDASLAEDLVQETALAAIEAPPLLSDGSPRPWLARVLKNRAAHAARSAFGLESAKSMVRDDARTEGAGGNGPLGDDEVQKRISEVETGRTLAELVLKLREPTRSTMLMRFWDDLPPRKIAKRQGVPIATVKSRLARGLAQLRAELDVQSGGDRSAWLLAVLPMARESSGAALITLGGIGMQAKVITMAGAATLLGGTLYFMAPSSELEAVPRDVVAAVERTEPSERRASLAPSVAPAAGGGERDALAAAGPVTGPVTVPAQEVPTAPTLSYTVEGTVLGADAIQLSGVPVRVAGGTPSTGAALAISDANGRFSLDVSSRGGRLLAADAGTEADSWVTVRPGTFDQNSADDALVIVARAIDLAGIVVDENGAAVGGVELVFDLPSDFVTRFSESHSNSIRRDWRTSSDANGRFVLEDVPSVAGGKLEATRAGGESVWIEAPTESRDDLRLELRPAPIPLASRLDGRVIYPDGIGASGAYVSMGFETIRADEDGRFSIDMRAAGAATVIAACALGFQPGEVASEEADASGETEGGKSLWPSPLEIRLRAPALKIEGSVVDSEGEPQAGARIWVHDPTDFGVLGTFPLIAEGIAGGFADPAGADRSRGRLAKAEGPVDESSATGAERPTSMLPYVVSDEDGRFELTGLLDRSYVLNVAGKNLSFGMQTDPVQAGDRDVIIERPEGTVFPELRGQVITRRGQPLPGVNITPWVAALSKDQNVRGGRSSMTRFFYAKGARTDEEGRFTLKSVPKRHIEFWIAGEGVSPLSKSVWEVRDPLNFVIEMAARTEVSVEITDPSSGIDRVTAQGFDGEAMDLIRIYADGSSNMPSLDIEGGRTGVFALTTDAATLTLMRGEIPVEVIDLDGDTEEVQRIVY